MLTKEKEFDLNGASKLPVTTLREMYLLNLRDVQTEEAFHDYVVATIANGNPDNRGSGYGSGDWSPKEVYNLLQTLTSGSHVYGEYERTLRFANRLASPFLNSKDPFHYKKSGIAVFCGILRMAEQRFTKPGPGYQELTEWQEKHLELILAIAKETLNCYDQKSISPSVYEMRYGSDEGKEVLMRTTDGWIFGRRDGQLGDQGFQNEVVGTFVMDLWKHAQQEQARLKLDKCPGYEAPVREMMLRCCHHAMGNDYIIWPRIAAIFGEPPAND